MGDRLGTSAPDHTGSRYDCYAPPNRRKRGCAGPPSTTEIEDSLLEGWIAAFERCPGAGGRAPVPTVRVKYASNRRRLVATSSEKVQVTGAGTAQVNGWYHQMKPSDGPPKGWPYTESLFWKKANQRWYEKDDGCYIHRSGASWYISTPDGYGSRYECRFPPGVHDREDVGPPSTKEASDFVTSYKGWQASYGGWHP